MPASELLHDWQAKEPKHPPMNADPHTVTHEGNCLGVHYSLSATNGVVLSSQARTVTHVTGSQYGTSSSTEFFQTVFIKTTDGAEVTINCKNFEIPCREGTLLTVFQIKVRRGTKPIFAYNHQTRSHDIDSSAIRWTLFPIWIMRVFQILVGFAVLGNTGAYGIIFGPLAFFLAWPVFWIPLWFVSLFRSFFFPRKRQLLSWV